MPLCFQHNGWGDVTIIRKTEIHLGVVEKEKWEVKSAYERREEFWSWAKPGHGYIGGRGNGWVKTCCHWQYYGHAWVNLIHPKGQWLINLGPALRCSSTAFPVPCRCRPLFLRLPLRAMFQPRKSIWFCLTVPYLHRAPASISPANVTRSE